MVRDGAEWNFETDADRELRLTLVTTGGDAVSESFTIGLTDVNEAPTGLSLDQTSIIKDGDFRNGQRLAGLETEDEDEDDVFEYRLLDDAGGLVRVSGGRLEVADAFNALENGRRITFEAETTDSGGEALPILPRCSW